MRGGGEKAGVGEKGVAGRLQCPRYTYLLSEVRAAVHEVGSEAEYEMAASGQGHILTSQLLEPGMAGLDRDTYP